MKPLIILPLIVLLSTQDPSCDNTALFKECTREITAGGYLFLKSYDVKRDCKFSYVFTKGNSYILLLAENPTAKIPIRIYDHNRKVVADFSGFGEGKFKKIIYPCESSGIYYIEFSASDGQSCATCVLGFLRKS